MMQRMVVLVVWVAMMVAMVVVVMAMVVVRTLGRGHEQVTSNFVGGCILSQQPQDVPHQESLQRQ